MLETCHEERDSIRFGDDEGLLGDKNAGGLASSDPRLLMTISTVGNLVRLQPPDRILSDSKGKFYRNKSTVEE